MCLFMQVARDNAGFLWRWSSRISERHPMCPLTVVANTEVKPAECWDEQQQKQAALSLEFLFPIKQQHWTQWARRLCSTNVELEKKQRGCFSFALVFCYSPKLMCFMELCFPFARSLTQNEIRSICYGRGISVSRLHCAEIINLTNYLRNCKLTNSFSAADGIGSMLIEVATSL